MKNVQSSEGDNKRLSKKDITSFQKTVLGFYTKNKRDLPWRRGSDPYNILVSEIMLQQTQVDRVIPKYKEFLKMFPDVGTLAQARLADVLRVWQGLGYNRRAKMLHECAHVVVREHKGVFPEDYHTLKSLPGIGPYTAGAVCAFAYDKAMPIIETNIRSVYIHHFFNDAGGVTDVEILGLIETTLDTKQPKVWYWALMDYGTYIKKTFGNPNKRSRHYTVQSTFKGSDRQIRGRIIALLTTKPHTASLLFKHIDATKERIARQLDALSKEGFLIQKKGKYELA